ncbi:MAG TPA: sn-glycerol-3-phosphate ABC transporter ATP-binding protein UgpC [Lacipirellulaceae bacterium]|jgi:multiple sugar transport system ATP-binding protein|nr:sn-glycerol-3-phosphate ABC transporter ATP-binding protein UgpC [Lacipirellulaceae bacterium]
MSGVVLKHLDKTYPNGFHAVRDVNLEIGDGEFMVLVGPSGCGKSTTLRMVAGLEETTGGEIWIGDRLVNQVAPGDRDIAMVFQNYALYPHMSVYQNMAFGLKMRRTPKAEIEKRVREAAAILSIEQLLERRPRELSGGQRQRVALGRAIVREPKVFLFDEPLSNLDAKLRVQMRAEIARLHQRLKTTIIYVTHDQVEAMTLGDRIVLMDRGVIQQVDSPMAIYQHPANQFVASFIGSPAMNFIRGEIEQGVFRINSANGSNHEAFIAAPATNDNSPSGINIGGSVPNGPVVLGVRPEDLLARSGDGALGTVTLDVVEHMGHETMAHFALAGAEHVARLPADAGVQPGDRLTLAIRPGAYHLFSGADGRRLN